MALTLREFARKLASGDRFHIEEDVLSEPWPTGGGGSLPIWWTVVSTPGSESVVFDGNVGFFGTAPAAQPAAPVTLGDVIDALTELGLVAAA